MNHQQFINKYQGTFQREPGINSAECVWCAKLYCKEVLGFTLSSFGGSAKNGWLGNTFDTKYWKKINNSTKNCPKQGDIVFWDIGPYGHVAVCNTANINNITVIEQNHTGKEGDQPGDEIRVSQYDYKNVLGWFTPLFKLPIDEVNTGVIADISNTTDKCPDLSKNTFKNIPNYNQEVNGHCTIFASFGAMAYNTGKIFKNLRVKNTAIAHCNPMCTPLEAVRIVCKEFGLKYATLRGEEAEKALENGYSLVIAIVAPTEMIIDGIRDGVIDGTYNRDISKSHALCVIKEKDYFLVNSLGKYTEKGLFNTYKISKEQLDIIKKGSNQYLVY